MRFTNVFVAAAEARLRYTTVRSNYRKYYNGDENEPGMTRYKTKKSLTKELLGNGLRTTGFETYRVLGHTPVDCYFTSGFYT